MSIALELLSTREHNSRVASHAVLTSEDGTV